MKDKTSSTRKPKPITEAGLRKDFSRLTKQWRKDRGISSNIPKTLMHPAYLRIIGMGPAALPLILEAMHEEPDFWFLALRSITGENPVPRAHAGKLHAMTQDWLEWAWKKGYVSAEDHRKVFSKAG